MPHAGTHPEQIVDSTGRHTTVHKKDVKAPANDRTRSVAAVPPQQASAPSSKYSAEQEEKAGLLLDGATRYIDNNKKNLQTALDAINKNVGENLVIQSHQIDKLISASVRSTAAHRLGRVIDHARELNKSDAETVDIILEGLQERFALYSPKHSTSPIDNLTAEHEHAQEAEQFAYFSQRGYSAGF